MQASKNRCPVALRGSKTDLVYYGRRFYDPSLGRFINRDPIAEAGGNNLYAFCQNSPTNGADILGMGGFNFLDWIKSVFGGGSNSSPNEGGGGFTPIPLPPEPPTFDDDFDNGPRDFSRNVRAEADKAKTPGDNYRRNEALTGAPNSGMTPEGEALWARIRAINDRPVRPYYGPTGRAVYDIDVGEKAARAGMILSGLADAEAEALGYTPPSEDYRSMAAYVETGRLASIAGIFAPTALGTRPMGRIPGASAAENAGRQGLVDTLSLRARQLELGTDPARGFIQAEGTGGVRLEQALGRTIRRSADGAADFVDSQLGTISLKGPIPAQGSVQGLANAAIRDATMNTATRTLVIDTMGLTPAQVSTLKAAVQAGTSGTSKTIIYLH